MIAEMVLASQLFAMHRGNGWEIRHLQEIRREIYEASKRDADGYSKPRKVIIPRVRSHKPYG